MSETNFNPYTMYENNILYRCEVHNLNGFSYGELYSAVGEKEGDYLTYLIMQDGRTPVKEYFTRFFGDGYFKNNTNSPSRIHTLYKEGGLTEKVDLYRIQTVSLDKENDTGEAVLVSGISVKASYKLISELALKWEEYLQSK